MPEVEVRRNKDRTVARSVDPGVLGASELENGERPEQRNGEVDTGTSEYGQ